MRVSDLPADIAEQLESRKLKLSEAIRIGARMRPQCSSRMFTQDASCAIGAAYEAVTGSKWAAANFVYDFIERSFGIPQHGQVSIAIIVKKNYGESRESIADWLEAQGY